MCVIIVCWCIINECITDFGFCGWSIFSFSVVAKFAELINMAEDSTKMRVVVFGGGPDGLFKMTLDTAQCASHGNVTGKNLRKKQKALDAIAKELHVRERIDKAKEAYYERTSFPPPNPFGLSSSSSVETSTIPASISSPSDEPHRSPNLAKAVLPFNMHHVMCTLLTGDSDNAFMEAVLRSLPYHDVRAVGGRMFPNARNLLCVAKFPVADVSAEWVHFIPYVIQNINARAQKSTGALLLSDETMAPFRAVLARHVTTRAMHGCHPRETAAAAAVVMFMMYSKVRRVNTGTAVAGFVANMILLSEGFAPIPPHILESGTFGAALALDAAKWDNPAEPESRVGRDGESEAAPRLHSSITSTCRLLTSLRKACDACGNIQSSVGTCMLRCSRCRFAVYCSKHCQKLVYKSHKPFCDDNVCA